MTRGDDKKFDGDKPMWDLLPFEEVEEVVKVLTMGAKKYSPDGWGTVPDGKRRYIAAAFRHIVSYVTGSKIDDESGLPHLAHAVCCLLFIMGFERSEK